jgi:hypothetical protein
VRRGCNENLKRRGRNGAEQILERKTGQINGKEELVTKNEQENPALSS